MRAPLEKEWQEWLQHPATQALRDWASREAADLKDSWASGAFSHENNDASWAKNHAAIGACSILSIIEELAYEQIVEQPNPNPTFNYQGVLSPEEGSGEIDAGA